MLHCCVFRPANACVHMVKNNEKCSKIIKKVLYSLYARETHARLTQEHEEKCSFLAFSEKSTFLIIFERFSLFSTMWMHAQACVHWLKNIQHSTVHTHKTNHVFKSLCYCASKHRLLYNQDAVLKQRSFLLCMQ